MEKRVINLAVVACILVGLRASIAAQVPYRTDVENMRGRVLDLLFPRDLPSKPYYARFVFRYSDPDSQLVLLVYPGGAIDLARYSIVTIDGKTVSSISEKILQQDPNVAPKEIAAKFQINVNRSPVDQKKVMKALNDLKKIELPSYPDTFIAVDEPPPLYDYWFDSAGEVVHYSFYGSYPRLATKRLRDWMLNFKTTFP